MRQITDANYDSLKKSIENQIASTVFPLEAGDDPKLFLGWLLNKLDSVAEEVL